MPDFDANPDFLENGDLVEVRRRTPAGDLQRMQVPFSSLAAAATKAHNDDAAAHLVIARRTLAGNLVLTGADSPQQVVIPDADRDVTLPSEGATQWQFLLRHGGAGYTLTIRRANATAVATLIVGSPVSVAWDGVGLHIG